jgi:flagellin-like hook-associated protein FlgL
MPIVVNTNSAATTAQDVTKNTGDIENYSKEFKELQSQLQQIRHTKFNGMSVFAIEELGNKPAGYNLTIQSKSCVNPESYVAPPGDYKHFKYSRPLHTSPTGDEKNGSISINVVNLSHVLDMASLDKRYDSVWDSSNDGIIAGGYTDTINLDNVGSGGPEDNLKKPNGNAAGGLTSDGFISSILAVSMAQITYCIEKLSDARAENGAEANRALQVVDLLQSNLTNLEAAHGRIMDADIALESTKFARQNVLVQAGASMTAQANQLTNIALTLLG